MCANCCPTSGNRSKRKSLPPLGPQARENYFAGRLRSRWDELFFTDLPSASEREQIWRIQIGRCGRKAEAFDVEGLALASEGHTGAEIGQSVTDALYRAFAESREPKTGDMLAAVSESVPLSKLMGEQIAGLRKWAAGRCSMAAKSDAGAEPVGRRIAA